MKLKRILTQNIGHIDNCAEVCLDDMPLDEATQIVLCTALINEYRAKYADYKHRVQVQKDEIKNILARLGKMPYARDLVVYTEMPERYGDIVQDLPDGIVLTSTAKYIQNRFDVVKYKRLYPETAKSFIKRVQCKGKVMTGAELRNLVWEDEL